MILFLVVAIGFLAVGFLVGRLSVYQPGYRVEVGQSHDGGVGVDHTVSARIVDRKGYALHYERVDMNRDDWEDQIATATVKMKQKLRGYEAAQRIAEGR